MAERRLFSDLGNVPVPAVQHEWHYTMRRSMQEIYPGIFIGPGSSASKSGLQALKNAGITHIICVRHDDETKFMKPNFEDSFRYLVVPLAESIHDSIIPKAKEIKPFIDECLAQGGKVLVYCQQGLSRSPALVIAYIMEKHGLTYDDALGYVQERRLCAQPNDNFKHQLMEFEPIYQAQFMSRNGDFGHGQGQKRGCEDPEPEPRRYLQQPGSALRLTNGGDNGVGSNAGPVVEFTHVRAKTTSESDDYEMMEQ